MPKFRVEVREVTTIYREKYFEADSEEAAKQAAEAEDWRTWDSTYDSGDCGIELIEEVGTP